MNKILVLGAALTISSQALAAVEPDMIQADIQKQVDSKQLTPKQATVLMGSYCIGAAFSVEMQIATILHTNGAPDMEIDEVVSRFEFSVPRIERQMKEWMSAGNGFNDAYYNVGLEYAQSAAEGDVSIDDYITDLNSCGNWLVNYTPFVNYSMEAKADYDSRPTDI